MSKTRRNQQQRQSPQRQPQQRQPQQRQPQQGSQRGNGSTGGTTSASASGDLANVEKQIHDAGSQAINLADEADLAAIVESPKRSDVIDLNKLRALADEADTAVRLGAAAKSRFEKRQEALAPREQELGDREQALKLKEDDLGARTAAVQEQQAKVDQALEELAAREDRLKEQELKAVAGFVAEHAAERRRSLAELEAELELGRQELSGARKRIADERAAWEAERAAAAAELDAEIANKRRELRELLAKADVEREMLDEDRQLADLRAENRVARDLEEAAAREQDLQERIAAARAERDRLYEQLRERDEASRAIGNDSPEEIKRRLDRLTAERDEARAELARRISPEERERLEDVVRAHEVSEAARAGLAQENAELRASLGRYAIATTELETLRDQKASLESSREMLRVTVKDLREEVDALVRRAEGSTPFPQCSAMDQDARLQAPVMLAREAVDLADFADDLRQRIAYDPATGKELYYSERDIRCFVGGLAMSRLHLLQGISGTGKTSLPLAAARALGAGLRLVEVQAGWRDRHDLIGHYNEFQHRFYETEFLQALYEAHCPAYRDRLYFVLLDEMNLSHPEQYFADLLSALELDQQRQKIDLMTAAVDPAPALLVGGRTMRIPPNVWFMGTANHDETTMGFADKTHDRAHVMELPRHRETFEPTRPADRAAIPLSVLQAAFDASRDARAKEAERAYAFIEAELGEVLGDRFGVGWGNRLQRQMEAFVPVVVDSGGTIGEAVDHIVATKLLRKIRDRHDNQVDDLELLRDALEDAWPRLKDRSTPDRSLGIISMELHRLGEDDGG